MRMKIAYNAGHILNTPGKRIPRELDPAETREWVLNDRVARFFAQAMSGYRDVELLRLDDPAGLEPIDIDARVARANEWGADFYLSIHHNAAGVVFGGGGYTVHIDVPGGPSEDYAWAIYKTMVDANPDMRGNRADPLVSGDEQRLYECRATKMPAVLVECGFMDSRTDAPVILTEDHARTTGAAIARAVAQVMGLKPQFEDVAPGRYYTDPVAWGVERGIIEGMTPTTFEPDAPCTRSQVVTFLWRLAGYPDPESDAPLPFTDVDGDSYYVNALAWAYYAGIVDGMSAVEFAPKGTATRGQLVTMLYRLAGCPALGDDVQEIPFEDLDADRYYYDAVMWACREAITMGMTPTTFEPDGTVTRGQVVTMLWRMWAAQLIPD